MQTTSQRIQHYLFTANLDHLIPESAAIETAIHAFVSALGNLPPDFNLDTLYTYKVPMLSEDGTCSLIEELAPQPYDIAAILGGRSDANTRKLLLLNQLVEHAIQLTGADWLGIYQTRKSKLADPVLVKLAYRGRPSRAEFPLNETFATGSTNSTVGLSGHAKVIDDVAVHTAAGGAFYVCDDEVQSEACVPVLDESGKVLGIIDAEAAPKAFFNTNRMILVVAMALVVPALLP
jgi:putative methionine-R-sulfoxide reductase with GAF domain